MTEVSTHACPPSCRSQRPRRFGRLGLIQLRLFARLAGKLRRGGGRGQLSDAMIEDHLSIFSDEVLEAYARVFPRLRLLSKATHCPMARNVPGGGGFPSGMVMRMFPLIREAP